jgi:hypothetical protein
MKHTPGPWDIRVDTNTEGQIVLGDRGRPYHVHSQKTHECVADASVEADALLIALAPELLEVLSLAIRYLDHPDVKAIPFSMSAAVVVNRARAAIAKAEGGAK